MIFLQFYCIIFYSLQVGGITKMKRNYEELIQNYNGGDLDLSGCSMKVVELGNIEGSLNLS